MKKNKYIILLCGIVIGTLIQSVLSSYHTILPGGFFSFWDTVKVLLSFAGLMYVGSSLSEAIKADY